MHYNMVPFMLYKYLETKLEGNNLMFWRVFVLWNYS